MVALTEEYLKGRIQRLETDLSAAHAVTDAAQAFFEHPTKTQIEALRVATQWHLNYHEAQDAADASLTPAPEADKI
jgi:hypothetical protein